MVNKTTATLRDVANAAGVSLMTVTNVIKKRKGSFSKQTEQRVLNAVASLGYRPNISAQNLRDSLTRSVGFIISDSNTNFLGDPFISQLVSGLSNYLSSVDYSLDIQGVAPENFENANLVKKAGSDAFCAILSGPRHLRNANIRCLSEIGKPVVVFQEADSKHFPNIAIIREDDQSGAYALGQHLLSQKAKRIVFVKPLVEWSTIEQRELGLRASLDRIGSDVSLDTIICDSESFSDVKEAIRSYLVASKPDAIVAATDAMGVAAMRMCEELGFEVPDDIKLAGFNGFEAWQYTTPLMATVVSPAFDMGSAAGETVFKKLTDGKFKRKDIVFSTQLRISDST